MFHVKSRNAIADFTR